MSATIVGEYKVHATVYISHISLTILICLRIDNSMALDFKKFNFLIVYLSVCQEQYIQDGKQSIVNLLIFC